MSYRVGGRAEEVIFSSRYGTRLTYCVGLETSRVDVHQSIQAKGIVSPENSLRTMPEEKHSALQRVQRAGRSG